MYTLMSNITPGACQQVVRRRKGAPVRASDRAYRALREDIVAGRLVPGTVLGEVEQSQRLGISRTPLREALSRLTDRKSVV